MIRLIRLCPGSGWSTDLPATAAAGRLRGEEQGSCDRISDCFLSLVFFRWAAPMEVNGLLEFYTLYQSALGEELAVIYNSSELFEDYTVRNLIPGSTYLFQIAVRSSSPVSPHTHLNE